MNELGAWLRARRERRLWSREEMAQRLVNAAEARGDMSMPAVSDVAHNIYRWERGAVVPSERYRLYHCDVLGIPAAQFGTCEPTTEDATIVIQISLPKGVGTRIRVIRPGDCSPTEL